MMFIKRYPDHCEDSHRLLSSIASVCTSGAKIHNIGSFKAINILCSGMKQRMDIPVSHHRKILQGCDGKAISDCYAGIITISD